MIKQMGQNINGWVVRVKVTCEFLLLFLQLFCKLKIISKLKMTKIRHVAFLTIFHHNKAWKIPTKLNVKALLRAKMTVTKEYKNFVQLSHADSKVCVKRVWRSTVYNELSYLCPDNWNHQNVVSIVVK